MQQKIFAPKKNIALPMGKHVHERVDESFDLTPNPLEEHLIQRSNLSYELDYLVGVQPALTRGAASAFGKWSDHTYTARGADEPKFFADDGLTLEFPDTNYFINNSDIDNATEFLHDNMEIISGMPDPAGGNEAFQISMSNEPETPFDEGGQFPLASWIMGSSSCWSYSFWAKSSQENVTLLFAADLFNVGIYELTDEWQLFRLFSQNAAPIAAIGLTDEIGINHVDGISRYPRMGICADIWLPSAFEKKWPHVPFASPGSATTAVNELLQIPSGGITQHDVPHTIAFNYTPLIENDAGQIFRMLGETNPRKLLTSNSGHFQYFGGTTNVLSAAGAAEWGVKKRHVITCDGTNFEYYINNELIGVSTAQAGISGTATNMRIHGNSNAGGQFTGLKLYDQHFSASEVPHA